MMSCAQFPVMCGWSLCVYFCKKFLWWILGQLPSWGSLNITCIKQRMKGSNAEALNELTENVPNKVRAWQHYSSSFIGVLQRDQWVLKPWILQEGNEGRMYHHPEHKMSSSLLINRIEGTAPTALAWVLPTCSKPNYLLSPTWLLLMFLLLHSESTPSTELYNSEN